MEKIDYREAVTYLLIIVLAVVTRAYGVWEWSLVGDEIYTLKSASERWKGFVGPAFYGLVALVNNASEIPEWYIRLPNLVLAVISVPTFYLLCSRTFGRRTAIVGTLILLISDWHLLHSQYARYYGGVFLFGTTAYFTYIEALKNDSQSLLAISVASCFLGALFHPTFLVVPLSCAVASALVWIWPEDEDPFAGFSKRIGKRFFLLSSVTGLIALPWSIDLIQKWNEMHSSAGTGDFRVEELFSSLLSLANEANVILSVSSLFGLYILLKRNVRLGVLLGLLSGIPVLVYIVGNEVASPFRPRYIFSFFPLVTAFAAFLISEVVRTLPEYGLAKYGVLMIVLTGMLPGFVSYYTVKQSLGPEDAVTVLEGKYDDGDMVLSIPIGVHHKISRDYPNWELVERQRAWLIRGRGWLKPLRQATREGKQVWVVTPSTPVPGADLPQRSWLINHASLVWQKYAFGYERAVEGMSIWRVNPPPTYDECFPVSFEQFPRVESERDSKRR